MPSNSSSHSNGRPPLRQPEPVQQGGHSFVFGSSTPRELSHISAVSRRERFIDTKLKPKPDSGRKDIVFYMRQARSIDGRGPDRRGLSRNYAFGSSTPRSLSHMSKLAKEQRVYDAKIERKVDAGPRSTTHPELARMPSGESPTGGEDEAASEPDFVQDRQAEFDVARAAAAKSQQSERENIDRGRKMNRARALDTKQPNAMELREEEAQEEEANHFNPGHDQQRLNSREPVEDGHGTLEATPEAQTERADTMQSGDYRAEFGRHRGPSPVSDF